MLLPHSKVELLVLKHLSEGPRRIVDMVEHISKKAHVTPESVYLAIRNLSTKRVIVKTKGVASLYFFWIQEMQKFMDSVHQSYGKEYTGLLVFRDIADPSFHSKTLRCANWNVLENTFHHIAQSIIQPQKVRTPYFLFGFAPWWMTLCPSDADIFIKLLVQYNYLPLMVFKNQYPIDRGTVARLKKLGAQIIFVDNKIPFGFEGHYTSGICLSVTYAMPQYKNFHTAYAKAGAEDVASINELMKKLVNTKVVISKKKIPFLKGILDMFAVSSTFF